MRATADRKDGTEEHIMMPGRVIPVREMWRWRRTSSRWSTIPTGYVGIEGVARSTERSGANAKAKAAYTQLLAQVGPTARRPELEPARTFVAAH
jgi:hypothetical protein